MIIVKVLKYLNVEQIKKIADVLIIKYPINVDMARYIISHVPPQYQLIIFSHIYRELPEQLSAQWHIDRAHKIGGSTVSAILGENRYTKPKTAVRRIFGIEKFNGNAATNWGTLLEPVAVEFIEIVANVKIITTGSIPGVEIDGRVSTAYSPDGLSWLDNNNKLENLIRKKIKNVNILWEIKCPFRRVPKGVVPNHYLSQPLMGLATLPIPLHCAVFADFMIRSCSLEDLNFGNKFIRNGHEKFADPVAIVLFAFYFNKRKPKLRRNEYKIDIEKYREHVTDNFEESVRNLLIELKDMDKYKAAFICRELLCKENDKDKLEYIYTRFNILGLDLIDLCGKPHKWYRYCNSNMKAKIISGANNGNIKMRRSKLYYSPPKKGWRAVINQLLDDSKYIGLMAFKIIDAHFNIIDGVESFVENKLPTIFSAAKKINKIIAAENKEELINLLF